MVVPIELFAVPQSAIRSRGFVPTQLAKLTGMFGCEKSEVYASAQATQPLLLLREAALL